VRFTKMHGAGNDYVYIDGRNMDKDWSALSIAMSDRNFGVGSDGVIVAMSSEDADLKMMMFNADGSEGKMCGNGIRCLVAFALKQGIVKKSKTRVMVSTLSGLRWVEPKWENDKVTGAVVGMGDPIFIPDEIPVMVDKSSYTSIHGQASIIDYPIDANGYKFDISCVSMGNPHAVAFIDTPVGEVKLGEIGPHVEHLDMFPERVNFEIANIVSNGRIEVRVWERGSGLTMACGTGACAVAVISQLKNQTSETIEVSLPGGVLAVTWKGTGEVIMEGPVQEVYEGDWPD